MKIEPIYKFNNGNGANLCIVCRTIINTGENSNHLLCPKCQEKALTLLQSLKKDAEMALSDEWDKSDEGFEAQLYLINNFLIQLEDEESL